ncbi:hypothetical protein SISSUDRAFT_1043612 [Sistotremastrum suecicum HHB10207 ss-3]|uniref:Uncharacterized protein n=1 Tax=Sistotremastrum suecicum HHB10207 ss-3 TaxID=1314776 RepID=A0A166FPH7_9AGAM|nr:hypothetical protein SISSUDRAFT_1043612 [Sistotremastrum suecicum HHB10207 ss-3]
MRGRMYSVLRQVRHRLVAQTEHREVGEEEKGNDDDSDGKYRSEQSQREKLVEDEEQDGTW